MAQDIVRMAIARLCEPLKRRYPFGGNAFCKIHTKRQWATDGTVSGHGSTLNETAALRRELPKLLSDLKIVSLLDIPCGDCNWMQHIPVENYIGMDVVPDLIRGNAKRYPQRSFAVADIVHDALPKCDMILCRDCLVHLPLADAMEAIKRSIESGSTYFAATTYPNQTDNVDKAEYSLSRKSTFRPGDWRRLNLQLPPFIFPEPVAMLDECGTAMDTGKYLGVWRIDSLGLEPKQAATGAEQSICR